jgi:hypothetical protein
MAGSKRKAGGVEGAVAELIHRIARSAAAPSESVPTRMRQCPLRQLDDAAVQLLGSLPDDLRLVWLRGQYPRILNRIAAAWADPRRMRGTLDGLLLSDRPSRAGFPFAVVQELTELRSYYFGRLHPDPPVGPVDDPAP